MGKVKVEKISVDENYIYPTVNKKKIPRDKLYKEKALVRKREITIDENLSGSDKVLKISDDLKVLDNRFNDLKRKSLMIKLFTPAKWDLDNTFDKEFSLFENYLKKYQNDLMLVSKYFNAFRIKYDEKSNTINEIIDEVYRLFDFSSGLSEDVEAIKKKYFNEFKVTSHALIKDKTLDQIEDLIYRVDAELASFKTLESASDYITYNSGKLITSVVKGMVEAKKKVKGDLSYHFFLSTDEVIAFALPEWIELFVRLNYVINKVGDGLVFNKELKDNYRALETKYAIMVIASEKHEKKVAR